MAKKVKVETETGIKVEFIGNFTGSFNGYSIRRLKGEVQTLPLNVFEWIGKFKVVKRA